MSGILPGDIWFTVKYIPAPAGLARLRHKLALMIDYLYRQAAFVINKKATSILLMARWFVKIVLFKAYLRRPRRCLNIK